MKREQRFFLAFVMLLAVILPSAAVSREGDAQVDFSLDIATEPARDFDAELGFTLGGGYQFMDEWQLRGDLSYYSWDRGNFFSDEEFTRIPVSASVRKYFTLPPPGLKVFGQAGVEISFDDNEFRGGSDDDVNVGLPIAGGVDYSFRPEWSVNGTVKHHFVEHDYTTINFGISYHF